jgi:signal recognition particle receptor subunit beta
MPVETTARDEHVFKLLVTGPFAAGKSSLIGALSQTPIVTTEVATSGAEASVKAHTTVAMDFGTYVLDSHEGGDDVKLLVFGTPGQRRFQFMTDVMKGEVDAVIYVIDAQADRSHPDAGDAMRALLSDLRVPLVVAVNRCDDPHRATLVARQLGALASEMAVPCQLIEDTSAREVVIEALVAVLDRMETGDAPIIDPIERVVALAGAA